MSSVFWSSFFFSSLFNFSLHCSGTEPREKHFPSHTWLYKQHSCWTRVSSSALFTDGTVTKKFWQPRLRPPRYFVGPARLYLITGPWGLELCLQLCCISLSVLSKQRAHMRVCARGRTHSVFTAAGAEACWWFEHCKHILNGYVLCRGDDVMLCVDWAKFNRKTHEQTEAMQSPQWSGVVTGRAKTGLSFYWHHLELATIFFWFFFCFFALFLHSFLNSIMC